MGLAVEIEGWKGRLRGGPQAERRALRGDGVGR
jgi:hypothetical protein